VRDHRRPLDDRRRAVAERVIDVHPARAADALQLGAAIVAADGAPAGMAFVTLDMNLADAAELEGFEVLRQQDESISESRASRSSRTA
jgi:uncharacterized protein